MEWFQGSRSGETVEWRHCDCDEWTPTETIPAGVIHMREKIADTDVEICYHVNEADQVITVLRIRTMG